MARELKPCGTTAAYRRHLRAGETPDAACVEAARVDRQEGRSEAREASITRLTLAVADAPMADLIDELDETLANLRIVKAAMDLAPAAAIASLSKRWDELTSKAIRLQEKARIHADGDTLAILKTRRAARVGSSTG